MTPEPTKADELVKLIQILGDAPAEGYRLSDIEEQTQWSGRKIQERILDLGGKVTNQKLRRNKDRVPGTYYSLKASS